MLEETLLCLLVEHPALVDACLWNDSWDSAQGSKGLCVNSCDYMFPAVIISLSLKLSFLKWEIACRHSELVVGKSLCDNVGNTGFPWWYRSSLSSAVRASALVDLHCPLNTALES